MSDAMENETDAVILRAISQAVGWGYFTCWGLSFYPQISLNIKRKSTQGSTKDFPTLNLLGFFAYTISNSAFLWSTLIRKQYAQRHAHSPEPTVRFNDWAFSVHALILCIVVYSQFYPNLWGFQTTGRRQRTSIFARTVFGASILSLVLSVMLVLSVASNTSTKSHWQWKWIDVIYTFSYVKLACTLVKYTPQAYLNFKRKSTIGWSIHQILLDFSGGTLSLIQLIIDSSLQADWSGLTGNPVKFGLANISLLFDVIFICQHYVLYPQDTSSEEQQEQMQESDRLLENDWS